MKKKIWSITAGFLCIALGSAPVMASSVTIDDARTGSLTIHKYDTMTARLDGITESPTATGREDDSVEALYADYSVQGVEFTYVKVAELGTYSEVQKNGTEAGQEKIQVSYGMASDDELLTILGLTRAEAIQEDQGKPDASTCFYSSDTLIQALVDLESADWNTAKDQLENYARIYGTAMPLTDDSGVTSAANLPLGLYLVVETRVPEQITDTVNPFFVSLPMTVNEGDEWNYDVTVYPKNQSGMPTLEKMVAEVTTGALIAQTHEANDPAYAPTATASDGDLLYYQITSCLPVIRSEATYLTDYTFVDTLGKGIEYNPNDVVLTWYTDAACTNKVTAWRAASEKFQLDYAAAVDGASTMTVTMTAKGLREINTFNDTLSSTNYGEYYLRISYSAVVKRSSEVVYGEAGNPNTVVLTWKRTNTAHYDTLKDECIVYTFGLDMAKQFSGHPGNFSRVSFQIKNATDQFYLIADKASDGVYYVNGEACEQADQVSATTFVPNSADGSLYIYGLEDDTYIIEELSTDDRYTLLKEKITVDIETQTIENVLEQNGAVSSDGTPSGVAYDNYRQISMNAVRTASATVDGNPVAMKACSGSVNALVPMTVVNTPSFFIPKTGDDGAFLLPILGLSVSALLMVFGYRMLEKYEKKVL